MFFGIYVYFLCLNTLSTTRPALIDTTSQTQPGYYKFIKKITQICLRVLYFVYNENGCIFKNMFILHIFDTMQSGLQSGGSSHSKSDLETALDDFFYLFVTEHVYTTNGLSALRAQYAEASRQYSLSIFSCRQPALPEQYSDGCHPMTLSLNHYKDTMCVIISASVSLYLKNKLLDDMHGYLRLTDAKQSP